MRADFRRRSTTTWAVWGGAFVAVTLLMAWKFQWFGGDVESVVEDGSADEVIVAGDPDALNDNSPEIFGAQSEPRDDDMQIPNRYGSSAARRNHSLQPWDAPTEAPPSNVEHSGNSFFPAGSQITASREPNRLDPSQYKNSRRVEPAGYDSSNEYNSSKQPPTYRRESEPIRLTGVQQSGYETPTKRASYYQGKGQPRQPDQYAGRTPPTNNGVFPAGNEVPQQQFNSKPPATLLARIDGLIQRNEILAAHKELSNIYWQKPEWRSTIKDRIERSAELIYFSPKPHFLKPHVVQQNEYLSTVAKKYHVTYEYLARLNKVDPRAIRAGQELKVIKGPFAVVVDLSDRELTLHHKGWFVARFRVAIGRDQRSPKGTHRVKGKVTNPEYTANNGFQNARPIKGGDPRNPLGTHWIDIGNSFGIHGTNDPTSIGKAASQGCVRMLNADVAWVYDFLTTGSEIVIQD